MSMDNSVLAEGKTQSDSEAVEAGASTEPHAPELGILLVHGIGEQKQGETLNEFGTPILKWIDQWLEQDIVVRSVVSGIGQNLHTKPIEGSIDVREGMLRPPDLPLDEPAHATVLIKRKENSQVTLHKWLFAESWWSPQTLTPQVSKFLLWLITRGPWVLLLHLSQVCGVNLREFDAQIQKQKPAFRDQIRTIWWSTRIFAVTLVWLALSLLVVVAWMVVSLIALVPVGAVRAKVYAFLQSITGVVGDSYVLINDPIQRAAFVESTRRGLAWLRQMGCAKVAVVAHSQGAAVARDVLFKRNAPQVELLVTLGPGLAKLDALDDRERRAPWDFIATGTAAPVTFLTIAAYLRLSAGNHEGFALWGLPIFLGSAAFFLVLRSWKSVGTALSRIEPNGFKVLLWRQYQFNMRWRDFYASKDPVPNGSISDTVAKGMRWIKSRRVTVLGSMWGDHTGYWQSRAGFVGQVVFALSATAGTRLFGHESLRPLGRLKLNHRLCVHLLGVLRWASTAALVLPLLFHMDKVREAGTGLATAIMKHEVAPLDSLVKVAITSVDGLKTATLLPKWVDSKMTVGFWLLALGAIAVVHVWGRIVKYWWEHMSNLALTPVFRPGKKNEAATGQVVMVALVSVLGVLPLWLSAAWTISPDSLTLESLDTTLKRFAQTVLLLFYGLCLGLGISIGSHQFKEVIANYRAGASLVNAVRQTDDWWVTPFYWVVVIGLGGYGGWQAAFVN